MNHFEEENKANEMNTVDPPFQANIASLGHSSVENQDLETFRIKFIKEIQEDSLKDGFEVNLGVYGYRECLLRR